MASKYWHRTSLTGGIDGSLDNIDGALLSNADKAYVATATAFYVYNLNATSGAAESSPAIISPDRNAGNKRWELVQSFASKTMAAISKTIGATGDYATLTDAIDAIPDFLAHNVTLTIQAGTTLSGAATIKNKHATTNATLSIVAEKYYPTGGTTSTALPTADSATATTLVDAELATAALGDDYFNGCWVFIVDGTGTDNGFVAITDYIDATGTVTVASWPGTQPDNTSRYMIVGALIDANPLTVQYCTVPVNIYGIGQQSHTSAGFNINGCSSMTYKCSGAYGNSASGILITSTINSTMMHCGWVNNNSGSGVNDGGVQGNAAMTFTIYQCGISDNNVQGIKIRGVSAPYISNNYGDNNGTWGTSTNTSATSTFNGTECSGSSGDHTP